VPCTWYYGGGTSIGDMHLWRLGAWVLTGPWPARHGPGLDGAKHSVQDCKHGSCLLLVSCQTLKLRFGAFTCCLLALLVIILGIPVEPLCLSFLLLGSTDPDSVVNLVLISTALTAE
jgi:hypothetical protein